MRTRYFVYLKTVSRRSFWLSLLLHTVQKILVSEYLSSAEKNEPPIRWPLHKAELGIYILAPESVSIYIAHNNLTIFVCNAYLLSIRWPSQVFHYTLVPVVDHFFKPHSLAWHHIPKQVEILKRRSVTFLMKTWAVVYTPTPRILYIYIHTHTHTTWCILEYYFSV